MNAVKSRAPAVALSRQETEAFAQLAAGISAPPIVGDTFVFAEVGTGRWQAVFAAFRLIVSVLRFEVRLPSFSAPHIRFSGPAIVRIVPLTITTLVMVAMLFINPLNFSVSAPLVAAPAATSPEAVFVNSHPALGGTRPAIDSPAKVLPTTQSVAKPATKLAARPTATTHKVAANAPQKVSAVQFRTAAAPKTALSPRTARSATRTKAASTQVVPPTPIVDGKFPTSSLPVAATPPAPAPTVDPPALAVSNFEPGTGSGTTGNGVVDQAVLAGNAPNPAMPDSGPNSVSVVATTITN